MQYEYPYIFYTIIYEDMYDNYSKSQMHNIIFLSIKGDYESYVFFEKEHKKYYNFMFKNNLPLFDEEIEISNGIFEIMVSGIKSENFNFNGVVNNVPSKISSFTFENTEQMVEIIVDEINKWYVINILEIKNYCFVYPKAILDVFLKGLQIKNYKRYKLEECY